MASKFGYHSGTFTAKNMVAGSFVISGTAGQLKQKAITFPQRLGGTQRVGSTVGTPRIVLTQWLGSEGSNNYSIYISGQVCAVSGVTASGFTAVQLFPYALEELSGSASGLRFQYVAYGHYPNRRV